MALNPNPILNSGLSDRDMALMSRVSPDGDIIGAAYYPTYKNVQCPVVYKAEVSYVYSTADTGSSGPGTLVRQNLPGMAAAGMAYDTVVDSAQLFYTVGMDVSLRISSWAPVVRAVAVPFGTGNQGARGITYEYDISGIFTGAAQLLGNGSIVDLERAIAASSLPYCGILSRARLPSGLKQPFFPYEDMGMFKFKWPDDANAMVAATPIAAYAKASDYIPGWVAGYSLKSLSVTFSPQEYKFYTDFVVSCNSGFLYPMHAGLVTLSGTDLTEGFK